MPTFKIDNKEVKVGQDVRVEVEMPDGDSLCIILTHEGMIRDIYRDGELITTRAIMYDEME